MGGSRWTGLDGLRAFAITAVVGSHFGFLAQGGFVGVDLFFVLSGFLITSLLVREHEAKGQVSLSNFWVRRGLRLLPALLCAVALAILLVPWASPQLRSATFTGLPWVFTYSGNWAAAMGHQPLLGSQLLGLLPHTWSLAIEEQFYLVWPILLVVWFRRGGRPGRAAIVLAALALVDALYNAWAVGAWGFYPAYFRTDTHAMGLCAGCALAMAMHARRGRPISEQGARAIRSMAMVAVALFVVVCLIPVSTPRTGSVLMDLGTLSAVVLVASVVLAPHSAMVRYLSAPGLVWLGARSYGIYLFHYPFVLVFVQAPMFHGASHVVAVLSCLGASIALAAISFRFVERPFLGLKSRFENERALDGTLPSMPKAALVVATPSSGVS
jgi:peptidoglycan/LPS O-acetylase OafA/YrhL